jgi:hypothetical protein
MTTTIEHVRHRVGAPAVGHAWPVHRTRCGRLFVGLDTPDRNTRHHEPATSRCPECWR